MSEAVYTLYFVTSGAVAFLLLRGYRRSGAARLLLWSGLGFVGLCLNNLMLIADVIIFPQVDLSGYRALPALAGMSLLIFVLIWDSEQPQGGER
jgi:hypothetical protein